MATKMTKIAKQVIAAKNMIATVDSAEAQAASEGRELTVAELKKLGYVQDKGGTLELGIPDPVISLLFTLEGMRAHRSAKG